VIPSFDSSAELSAKDVDELVRAIRAEGVKAVFSEVSLPGDSARTIADEAGVAVVTGDEALYGDSLGPSDSDAATYIDMMRRNTQTIVSNLE
jgi:ABC-type Zn uptake system ZnuABC Zn-binding protein ZnuA